MARLKPDSPLLHRSPALEPALPLTSGSETRGRMLTHALGRTSGPKSLRDRCGPGGSSHVDTYIGCGVFCVGCVGENHRFWKRRGTHGAAGHYYVDTSASTSEDLGAPVVLSEKAFRVGARSKEILLGGSFVCTCFWLRVAMASNLQASGYSFASIPQWGSGCSAPHETLAVNRQGRSGGGGSEVFRRMPKETD